LNFSVGELCDYFMLKREIRTKVKNLKLGVDLGIISYNETPLKKVVENGITTISTDFDAMGRLLATMILDNNKSQIENKSNLIIRHSL